jgi:hypothetical protein
VGNLLYLIATYWPYLVLVFLVGIAVGWWSEGARDPGDVSAWLESGQDEP